jgi:hypothetical protein
MNITPCQTNVIIKIYLILLFISSKIGRTYIPEGQNFCKYLLVIIKLILLTYYSIIKQPLNRLLLHFEELRIFCRFNKVSLMFLFSSFKLLLNIFITIFLLNFNNENIKNSFIF